ncbi:MAG: hypothetical protein RL592_1075 [Verrucomicrobiota bacterium]|jgi:hypothetical protein|nr:hypothetical protein [Verrucomicrobiota bacterium]
MTDPDHDIEQALASLRPRAPSPALTARLAAELDAPASRRGVIIAWSAGLSAAAAALVAAFVFLGGVGEPEAPAYQLVRVEQSRPDVQFFRPVQMDDGSFARPVRVRWQDTTRWEDARSNTRLINYRPNDQFTLLPLETN